MNCSILNYIRRYGRRSTTVEFRSRSTMECFLEALRRYNISYRIVDSLKIIVFYSPSQAELLRKTLRQCLWGGRGNA